MAVMRAIQGVIDPDAQWRNKNGAPTKRDMVRSYAADHPDASHSEIAGELGISRSTVIKWLKPGWREEWEEAEWRREASSVTPIHLSDDEITWSPVARAVRAAGGEIVGLDAWDMAKLLAGTCEPDPGDLVFQLVREDDGRASHST